MQSLLKGAKRQIWFSGNAGVKLPRKPFSEKTTTKKMLVSYGPYVNIVFQGKTAYYPIIYSKFDPEATNHGETFDVGEREGFWREYGFGMVSLYQSDFAASGGFDLTLQGWGGEDIHLVTNFILRGKVNF